MSSASDIVIDRVRVREVTGVFRARELLGQPSPGGIVLSTTIDHATTMNEAQEMVAAATLARERLEIALADLLPAVAKLLRSAQRTPSSSVRRCW